MSAEILNLNNNQPPAPTGMQDGNWLKGPTTGNDPVTGLPIYPASVAVPMTGGAVVETANYAPVAGDCGRIISYQSASALTCLLPTIAPIVPAGASPSQWTIWVQCTGAGGLTVNPNGLNIDGSASSITLSQGQGFGIAVDAAGNYETVRGVSPATIVIRGLVFPIGQPLSAVSLSTSNVSGVLAVPFACTITGWSITLGSGDSGTVTIKVWKIAAGTAIPASGNSISTSGVSLATGTAIQSTTLTDFTTTAIAAGDMLAAAITSISGTIYNVTFELKAQ
jgi:hypothetical protein